MKLGYKIFVSSEEFEQWQEIDKPEISQIMPVYLSVNGSLSEGRDGDANLNAAPEYGCFVTYFVER